VDKKYKDWIEKYVPNDCDDLCDIMTNQIRIAFPELTFVAGNYIWYDEGEQHCEPHCWAVTPQNEIVDPTATQFPSGGEYEELKRNPLPGGICEVCGKHVFGEIERCSIDCWGIAK
jgi:hypothetical protein